VNVAVGTVLVILAAMSVGGFIKGATGQGLPQLAIPVMATFIGVQDAVVIMTIPGIVSNAWLLWIYRSYYPETRDLPVLLVAGGVGAIAGTVLLDTLNENLLSLTLAGMIVVYVVVFLTHPQLVLPARLTRLTSPPIGLAAGVLQGATGISGPVLSTYLHGYRFEKEVYVLSITTLFQVYAMVQGATLIGLGLYTTELLLLSLVSLVPIMVMLAFGSRFASRLSRRTFELVVIGLLVASAARLLHNALT
jgi:uncharacterized protein